jgi:hypothetical protein
MMMILDYNYFSSKYCSFVGIFCYNNSYYYLIAFLNCHFAISTIRYINKKKMLIDYGGTSN